MRTHPRSERGRVSSLHEHGPWAGKLADQAFSAAEAGDDATAGHALHDVFAVPGHKMAVVDDVFLAFDELWGLSAARLLVRRLGSGCGAHREKGQAWTDWRDVHLSG